MLGQHAELPKIQIFFYPLRPENKKPTCRRIRWRWVAFEIG
jgi:hypothetical protein